MHHCQKHSWTGEIDLFITKGTLQNIMGFHSDYAFLAGQIVSLNEDPIFPYFWIFPQF
jgi:hypothetical protein